ncbi:hypothetical protein [Streptomyces sp. WMMC897]|uniref:hypothetical protein n=1 Tax=Streptomyces sp. WMMC897 TaxID=3014782 RepID=UPI0022B6A766|nr:hypothetical protein [Streptomyces sp. WMMC897]MCZ7414233.1 hypothetical protein [Streptomyces sp. WMMC897]
MSYHQPPPQGPYGQQPQQPGPYGAPAPQQSYGQPGGAQPGYGYPGQQPPPPPGYGYPGQPGQPAPGAPPYGQPQQPGGYVPPPPPRKSNTGKVVGLSLGAVVLVGALVGGFIVFMGDDGGAGEAADDGPHKLVAPETVDAYKLQDGSGGSMGEGDFEDMLDTLGISEAESVEGEYNTVDTSNPDSLNESSLATMEIASFSGLYGSVEDPERAVDDFFGAMRAQASKDPEKGELVGDPEGVSPDGADGSVMKCQEIRVKASADVPTDMSTAVCMWADYSTVGMVLPVKPIGSTSVDDAASITGKFRKEARVPLG